MKYLTFSYDDGVTQDIRLVELFNKYGMKCTFNLNYGLLGMDGYLDREGTRVDHIKVKPEDAERTSYMFDLLLGDDLQGRKEFIAENGYMYLDDADIS